MINAVFILYLYFRPQATSTGCLIDTTYFSYYIVLSEISIEEHLGRPYNQVKTTLKKQTFSIRIECCTGNISVMPGKRQYRVT